MNKLPKRERLNSKIKINNLFVSGKNFRYSNIKVYWNVKSIEGVRSQIMIIVPKKKIALAVKRNKVKRLIKESYRVNKKILNLNNQEVNISFLFLSSEIPKYNSLEKKIKVILRRLKDEI
tara:strand:+ start:1357 stop:1716 length:360 start_codon:yes stop_codon:yes gene_type:complete